MNINVSIYDVKRWLCEVSGFSAMHWFLGQQSIPQCGQHVLNWSVILHLLLWKCIAIPALPIDRLARMSLRWANMYRISGTESLWLVLQWPWCLEPPSISWTNVPAAAAGKRWQHMATCCKGGIGARKYNEVLVKPLHFYILHRLFRTGFLNLPLQICRLTFHVGVEPFPSAPLLIG